ncbi:SPARC-like [Penaeus japonicus]|uniref:SPARC-like n=1 Tax=Penaeus japonicus TaxID=27405 RepID=UPI001C70D56C|nr:SPARC-like [Penaeus japonicus]
MKASMIVVLLMAVALTVTQAKKASSDLHKKHIAAIEEKLEHLMEMEAELESEIAEEEAAYDDEPEDEDTEDEAVEDEEEEEEEEEEEDMQPQYEPSEEYDTPQDPCKEMFCGAGRICVVTPQGDAECECVKECEPELDDRRKVSILIISVFNSSLCEDEEPGCLKEEYAHVHIDYYGDCQELPECETSELEDFPRRMNEWLFNIMRDMADRQILSEHYLQLEKEAEDNPTKRWTNAVVWKWCELDAHPRDRAVSRHELFPIRAPLVALEHCIGTFLDSCDPDDDHYITLKEWAKCTHLTEEHLNELEDMCEEIREQ